MFAFLVGLSVIVMIGAISVLTMLLFPLLLLLGIFARLILGLLVSILVVWLIGKITLLSIEYLRNRSNPE